MEKKEPKVFDYNKTELIRVIETLMDVEMKEYLRSSYEDKEMTFKDIIEDIRKKTRLNINIASMSRWFKRFGIQTRTLKWIREDIGREIENEYRAKLNKKS